MNEPIQKCQKAWEEYDQNPTKQTRDALKEAYEGVPEKERRFILGDMDVKDIPIRMVLYGEQEIENWSHRIVAKKEGHTPLPTITVKKPVDE